MGLNPFVQMAFGCAPLYIRLAAFLSAVSPNVSCGGSWYLNVTLEPPQIFNFSSYVIAATTTESTSSTSPDHQRWSFRHIAFLIPASRVPSWSCARCLAVQYRPSLPTAKDVASVRPATSTEVVCRRELRDFESLAAFEDCPRIFSFPMASSLFWWHVILGLLEASSRAASYGFSVGITDVKVRKGEIERHCLLNTGSRFAKDSDILPDILSVTYRHDSGENSARWYPYTWRLTLCHCHRLVKRWSFYTTLSLQFSGG